MNIYGVQEGFWRQYIVEKLCPKSQDQSMEEEHSKNEEKWNFPQILLGHAPQEGPAWWKYHKE